MQNNNQIRVAADIGGTFTDVVLSNKGTLASTKVPTDPVKPEQGIIKGVKSVLADAGLSADKVDTVIHGTTLATNALIERKGAKTALITTAGFRDSLEIAYENRFDQYDLLMDKPKQLIPRHLRFTVPERMDVRGNVLRELDREAVKSLLPFLAENDIGAVAVGLLHSYANPAHEQLIRDILVESGCDAEISLSSDVCPEVREYERLMTTACNAYVQPIMAKYLTALQSALVDMGIACPLFLMSSGGGMTTLESAVKYPIRLVESGPSGGAVLASRIAAVTREKNVLSFDMGGTMAKICLIDDYQPKTARNFEIARAARFQKGSGMPVRIPVVEMIEIGAGGGSIAHVDSLGRLAIGPQSAGSVPGPACYQKGGVRAAVTDADVVMGKIDPDNFAEGKMRLDSSAAGDAIERDVARPLDISAVEAASGVTEMVEESMANAARIHSVEHGSDLSRYTLIAFGGAGPLHAVRLAEKLNINRVIVPDNSSVGSAVGFLWAPVSYEIVRSRYMTLAHFNPDAAHRIIAQLAHEAFDIVRSGAPDEQLLESRTAYMRYIGQGHEIGVTLPNRTLTAGDSTLIQTEYEKQYSRLYGRTIPARDIEILSWSMVVSTASDTVAGVDDIQRTNNVEVASHRDVYIPAAKKSLRIPVYWRPDLQAGAEFIGPALVAEPQTTTFVTADYCASMDAQRNLILDRKEK